MLTDAEYLSRKRWNQGACAITLFVVLVASLSFVTQIIQPPRATMNLEFDISGAGVFLVTATDGISDGNITLRDGKPLRIGRGYGAIFGRSGDEVIYSGYVREGERALFAMSLGEEPKRLTNPSSGGQDYDCALSRDGKRLFFLRSLRPRTTSMGGVALGDIDLWKLDFKSGREEKLTHLAMFSASLGPRSTDDDSAVFVGWPSGSASARLLQVDGNGKVRDVLGDPVMGSGLKDLMSCTLDESGKTVFCTDSSFPSTLISVPLAGGPVKTIGQDKSMWLPFCRGNFIYYQAPVLTGQGVKKMDIRTGSSTIEFGLSD